MQGQTRSGIHLASASSDTQALLVGGADGAGTPVPGSRCAATSGGWAGRSAPGSSSLPAYLQAGGAGSSGQGRGGATPQAALFGAQEKGDSGTDADAISPLGGTNYDWDDLGRMGEGQMAQKLYRLKTEGQLQVAPLHAKSNRGERDDSPSGA